MKKERGITLIALVITIIVLLILAGVSISLVVGDNGVLTQATNSVETNRKASAKEDVEMAWAGATSKYWEDWANNSATIADLAFYQGELENKETSVGIINSISAGDAEGTYELSYTYKSVNPDQPYTFIIDANGKATLQKNGNAAEIAADRTNIGQPVNYGVSYTYYGSSINTNWEIFYADDNNVYLITSRIYSSIYVDK